jgi:hypothetical protein
MMAVQIMTVLCVSGVAFYVRFLVALCRECTYKRISYLVRIKGAISEVAVMEPRHGKAMGARAA